MDIRTRLESLKKAKSLTWEELGKELDLSRQMIHAALSGTRQIGPKAMRRIKEMEEALGIRHYESEELLRIEAAAALARKRGEPDSMNEILRELHSSPEGERLWRERALSAEKRLEDLQNGVRLALERSQVSYGAPGNKTFSSKLPSDVRAAGERAGEIAGQKGKA